MNLDMNKETTPVFYGESAIRILDSFSVKPNQRCFPLHWHDRMELIRVVSGSFSLYIGEEFCTTVKEGELAIICPCQPHAGLTTEEGVVYDVIMFDVDVFLNATDAVRKHLMAVKRSQIIFDHVTSHPGIIEAADSVINLQPTSPLFAIGGIYQLFDLFYRYCSPRQITLGSADKRFETVIEYVNNHCRERINSASLSAEFGYDESYFCRRFKKATGLTVMKYISVMRLEQAEKLLKKTELDIGEVASACGFVDASYFTPRFTKHFGMSPSEFRKQ